MLILKSNNNYYIISKSLFINITSYTYFFQYACIQYFLLLLSAAVAIYHISYKTYKSLGKNINPLMLIQIPNKKVNDIINPEDEIIEFLSKEGLTIQNGKVALWLSEDRNALRKRL